MFNNLHRNLYDFYRDLGNSHYESYYMASIDCPSKIDNGVMLYTYEEL